MYQKQAHLKEHYLTSPNGVKHALPKSGVMNPAKSLRIWESPRISTRGRIKIKLPKFGKHGTIQP